MLSFQISGYCDRRKFRLVYLRHHVCVCVCAPSIVRSIMPTVLKRDAVHIFVRVFGNGYTLLYVISKDTLLCVIPHDTLLCYITRCTTLCYTTRYITLCYTTIYITLCYTTRYVTLCYSTRYITLCYKTRNSTLSYITRYMYER